MSSMNEIPSGWEETTLEDIAIINPRETIKKGELAINIPMANLDSFSKKIQIFEKKEFKGGTKFRNGDTLMARITPCLENGKTSYVDILKEDEVGFGSTEYIVLREKEKISDKHFLYYLSISPKFRELAIKLMTGTSGRQRVQTNSLINRKLILPKYEEQKAIANILNAFDDKIENLQAQNNTLEQTAQTIFAAWFGKYKVGDELPDGWRVGKLEDFGEVICGKTPSKSNKEYYGDDIPFIKIPDMHNNTFIISTTDNLSEKGAASQKNKIIPTNSICVSCIATVGLVVITSKDSQTNQQINSLIPHYSYLREYLYLKISKMKKQLIDLGSGGTATLNVNTSTFSNIESIIPNEETLKSFHTAQKPLFDKILSNVYQIQSLKKTRDTILPKLMSGQLRVKMSDL